MTHNELDQNADYNLRMPEYKDEEKDVRFLFLHAWMHLVVFVGVDTVTYNRCLGELDVEGNEAQPPKRL